MLPNRLQKIDETTRASHSHLTEDDLCLYFGEFFANKGFQGGPTNQLVLNFKIKPTKIAATPNRAYYKNKARQEIAGALRRVMHQHDVNERCTFVPLPPSKIPGHPDYCDRGIRVLREAFHGAEADVRPLLRQTESTDADHEAAHRISPEALAAITEVDEAQLEAPPREIIVLFDDVLTTGKHFMVGKETLLQVLPGQRIAGLFVARCIHDEIDPETEFEVLPPE